ncbi:MAG TPA: carboxymuconolactone decarboxylase family protein [Erysipelothrix sp.]|nr:carboxymuconolactone decarboxylase family protein [Erysipelothrix sp.]
MKHDNIFARVPNGTKALLEMEKYFTTIDIDPIIKELIKIRASQINGCAYCLNMHTVDALKIGETPQRIFLLNAWHETDLFSEKEKVTLELVEKLTLVTEHHIDEDLYSRLSKYYDKEDFANLLLLITQINTWNRLNIAYQNDIDKNYK